MCINPHNLEEPECLSKLYIRRKDIDESTRIKIGIFANIFPRHGLITDLSRRYQVSRPFIYEQKRLVKGALSLLNKPVALEEKTLQWEENIKHLLLYRIRGGVSISKCSDFLSEHNSFNRSEGWISETIKYLGDLVGNVLTGWQGQVVFASDEIYMVNGVPVLVSVDPISSVILSITVCTELNKELWQSHWENLRSKNIIPLSIVGDEGKSLKAAHCIYKELVYQPDTFHAITQRFGKVLTRLEGQALRSIRKEYEREKVYLNAKSLSNQSKQKELYSKAQESSSKALSQLSDFKWLYVQINRQLKIVRSNGCIRTRKWAEGEVRAAIELMEETLNIDLEKEIQSVKNLLPDLFQYLDQAAVIYSFLEKQIPNYILPFYLAFWQYQRELTNLKKAKDKNRFKKSKEWLIQIIRDYQQEQPLLFEKEKQLVFAAINQIVQSSAMVECINSILRPIFNESKGQVSQQSLNLVMYWHNHRVYKKGKRKGKSPMELLTGNKDNIEWRQRIINLAKKDQALKKAA